MYSSVYGALKLLTEGGRESRRHLEELDRTQWLVPADLAHEQLLGLQAIVRHAYEHVTDLCPTCPRRLGPPLTRAMYYEI